MPRVALIARAKGVKITPMSSSALSKIRLSVLLGIVDQRTTYVCVSCGDRSNRRS